jgi:hypothetical protein
VSRTITQEPVTIREYEALSYDLLDDDAVGRLEQLAKGRGPRIFSFHRTHAQARHYVGTVKTGATTVQILPKIYERDEQNLGLLARIIHEGS